MKSLALLIVVALHPLSAPAQGGRVEVKPHDDGSINNTVPRERQVVPAPDISLSPTDHALGRRPGYGRNHPEVLFPPRQPVSRKMERLDTLAAELDEAVGGKRLDRRRASKRARQIAKLSREVWREILPRGDRREHPDPKPRVVRAATSVRADVETLSRLVDEARIAVEELEIRVARESATRPAIYDAATLRRLEAELAAIRSTRGEALHKLVRIEALVRQIRTDLDGKVR